MSDQQIERYFLALLALYTICGFYGTLWISDEFDAERALFYSFFGVPWALYVFIRAFVRPDWRVEHPVTFYGSILILVMSFSWGNLLALNAIAGSEKAVVNITLNQGVYAITQQRGGFNWLYKPRW